MLEIDQKEPTGSFTNLNQSFINIKLMEILTKNKLNAIKLKDVKHKERIQYLKGIILPTNLGHIIPAPDQDF
jgi:hypothetical protein